MSFLKNILGAFVEFKDKDNVPDVPPPHYEKPANPANGNPAIVTTNTAVASAPGRTTTSHTAVDYEKHFEEIIEEANASQPLFTGTDFKEFIDSKSDVEAIADEPTKYRTAFNVLKRTGLTKEKLLSTGKEYINIIDNDLKAFENAFVQQYKTDVESRELLLQQKAQELQLLTEKTASLNAEIKGMSQQIMQSKERLTANKNSFVLAGENKKNEIKTELGKIEQYF